MLTAHMVWQSCWSDPFATILMAHKDVVGYSVSFKLAFGSHPVHHGGDWGSENIWCPMPLGSKFVSLEKIFLQKCS